MAGGPDKRVVRCINCGARAERTHEGIEDDYYECEAGHRFGIDWSYEPPPTEPHGPFTAEQLQEQVRELLKKGRS